MPALVQDERIYETSVTTGTGEYTLAGAVTGFQPASVIGANNYLIGFVTDDINWEAGIYTYVAGPDRLQRTAVVASSNGDAAVNWGAGTKKLRCGPLAFFEPGRQVSKSVAGAVDVTLTALEQRCDQLILTGVLTGNINVIVDSTKWGWEVYNNTSGAYTLTLKTSAGTGIAVTQGKRLRLFCDGTNVVREDVLPLSGGTMTGAITLSGDPTSALHAATKQYVDAALAIRGYIDGLTMSTAGSSASMTIAAGGAANSTNAFLMALAAAITKTTSAWAVGSAAGGLDTGAIANTTWYHFYLIKRVDTGVVDVVFSTNPTTPTLPANYTLYRRIGSGLTNGAAQWTLFIQDGDLFQWAAPVIDVSVNNPGTSAVTRTLTVPTGVNVQAIFRASANNNGSAGNMDVDFSDLSTTDAATPTTGADLTRAATASGSSAVQSGRFTVRTNTSAQVRSRANFSDANCFLIMTTLGWIDQRGRNA